MVVVLIGASSAGWDRSNRVPGGHSAIEAPVAATPLRYPDLIADHEVLEAFSPAVRAWFATSFPEPTAAQQQGWPPIAAGEHTLICAPTGSGKTLAAFLSAIDALVTAPTPDDRTRRTRVLYISPLRALAFDVEKNLRAPLSGIALAAERIGQAVVTPEVAMRTGDTAARDRQRLVRRPPDLLITTPESLYLMLTSSAAETLVGVETVIVDEIHALAATKRGAHLAVSLERLEALTARPPQRIGLSATQRPLEEVARFLGGFSVAGRAAPGHHRRRRHRQAARGRGRHPRRGHGQPAVDGGRAARAAGPSGRASTRASSTRCSRTARRSSSATPDGRPSASPPSSTSSPRSARSASTWSRRTTVRSPVSSASLIEDELKRGTLRGIVATSSLELGIDMGAVDLVIQVESPGAVSRGLQRIGRAGHQVGEPSRGTIYPKHRGDLLEAAVVTRRMLDGRIESTRYLRNPLDVLAQQLVAHVAAVGETPVGELAALVRRTATFADLSDEQLANTLDLLAGRYPSEEFSELRPRVVWNRVTDTVRARDGSKRLAVTSGGTIPDRGLFGVFLPDGKRVGELDEEMVYESRPGETFILGASTWRIEDISFERVTVTPAPGEPGKMPFWHGDRPGRPLELGRALGEFVRELRELPAGQGDGVAPRRLRPRRAGGVQPAAVRQRAGGGDGCRSRRPHDRRRAVPRRDRRLAGVPAQPVRHAGARAVGDGHRTPAGRPLRPAGRVDVG